MNAIETENLCRDFKTVRAVDNLNLSVKRGELFALLGTNGAGKSTTINMLTCLLRPTSGAARVMGYDVVKQTNDVKRIIGVCPQKTAVARLLTVRENLGFMCEVYGMSKADAKKRTDSLIEEFDLGEVEKRMAKRLSGGYERRLSIAMAFANRPEVLFLDEPTLGLDVLARRELWKGINRIKGNTTVILTTHYLEEAETFADRIGIMAKGRLCAVGTVSEITVSSKSVTFEDAFVKTVSGGDNETGVDIL